MLKKPTYEELEQKIKELETSVAEGKGTKNKLEQKRDKLQILINSMIDEVWFCDTEGQLSLVNISGLSGLDPKKTNRGF